MNSLHRNAQLSLGVFKPKHLLYVFDQRLLLSPNVSIKAQKTLKLLLSYDLFVKPIHSITVFYNFQIQKCSCCICRLTLHAGFYLLELISICLLFSPHVHTSLSLQLLHSLQNIYILSWLEYLLFTASSSLKIDK